MSGEERVWTDGTLGQKVSDPRSQPIETIEQVMAAVQPLLLAARAIAETRGLRSITRGQLDALRDAVQLLKDHR